MKIISMKETDSILFNLDSMRTHLLNEQYEHPEKYEEFQIKIDEIEKLLYKMNYGLSSKELARIRGIVAERKFMRYVTCLNAGLPEQIAGGAFAD